MRAILLQHDSGSQWNLTSSTILDILSNEIFLVQPYWKYFISTMTISIIDIPSAMSATPATQNDRGCEIVPRLPRETKVDVTKCHACHAKCRGVTRDQAGPSAPPSAMSATPATQNDRKVPRRHARPSGPKRATQCHERHACHAKRPWMWDCATPATWNQGGCSPGARLPRKVPRRHVRPSGPKRATQCHECHACHAKRRWMWDCATPGVWQSCVERWCVTKLCVNVGVWQSCVCESWCVTKWCVTKLCWKLVCDKVVCEIWCVTKWCVTKLCWMLVCDKVVCESWCVTKLCVEGVWQSCVSKVCDKVVCERWCVQHGWWQMMCDKVVCVWSYCMWKMVCDKVVCRRCVTKLCVKDGVQSCMWQRWYVTEQEEAGGGRRGTGATWDTESKTRTPRKAVGNKHPGKSMFWSHAQSWQPNIFKILLNTPTSSTAQGGGGSFKNRKPVGGVSCCGAKMAERTHWWIERWLSVSAFLSFSFSFSLSLSFGIYLQSYLSSHLPIYLSIHASQHRMQWITQANIGCNSGSKKENKEFQY